MVTPRPEVRRLGTTIAQTIVSVAVVVVVVSCTIWILPTTFNTEATVSVPPDWEMEQLDAGTVKYPSVGNATGNDPTNTKFVPFDTKYHSCRSTGQRGKNRKPLRWRWRRL